MTGDFDPKNPHAWISMIVFPICILFVILSPSIPIPYPTWNRIKEILGMSVPMPVLAKNLVETSATPQDEQKNAIESAFEENEPQEDDLDENEEKAHIPGILEAFKSSQSEDDAEIVIYHPNDGSIEIFEKETLSTHTAQELQEIESKNGESHTQDNTPPFSENGQGIVSDTESMERISGQSSNEMTVDIDSTPNHKLENSSEMTSDQLQSTNGNYLNVETHVEVQDGSIALTSAKATTHSFRWPGWNIYRFPLDMGSAPVFAVIFMLCTTTITAPILFRGIIGDDFIQPYAILIIFFAPAYCCISIDVTGLFEFISHFIIAKSKNRGHVVYIGLMIFSSILTIFASNDVTILTLTPICCYMAKSSENLDFIPFVVSQYFMANVWGMMLEIGNPTNVIVAEAYKIGFLEFSAWMAIPTLVTGFLCFILLYAVFYKKIPTIIIKKEVHQKDAKKLASIKSIPHAVIKSIGLGIFLFFCSISSFIHFGSFKLDLWHVCAAAAVGFIIYDIFSDVFTLARKIAKSEFKLRDEKILHYTFFDVCSKLPWKIIPFVIGMFIIVELLHTNGWISLLAKLYSGWMKTIVPNQNSTNTITTVWSIVASTISMSFVSAISCNFLNSQPMTILFTNMLNDPQYAMSPIMKLSSILSLILGSNVGANISLIGALCGLMWSEILKKAGMPVGYFKFLMYGALITPIVILISSFVLATEIVIWNYTGFVPSNGTMTELTEIFKISP